MWTLYNSQSYEQTSQEQISEIIDKICWFWNVVHEIREIWTVETDVFIIIMYLFNYICVHYLLVLTNAHIILIYILCHIYVFSYIFLLFHTKWLKIHSDKLVPKMLCMCMYSMTKLLLWVLSYLVVRSMRMETRQNMHETESGRGDIYLYSMCFCW